MSLTKPTLVDAILDELLNVAELLPRPFETVGGWSRRLKHYDPHKYRRAARDLQKRGLVKIGTKNGERFIQLTKEGVLEALLTKAAVQRPRQWDNKWRLIMFDIPEECKEKRYLFRSLLKKHGFYKLQASVYINPFPLNQSAIQYLQKAGLMEYIRILRVDAMDNDESLRKYFQLK